MSRPSIGARLVMLTYPRWFRREFGDEMTRSMADMRSHGGLTRTVLAARLARDVVRSAPRMRLESLVNGHKPLAVAALLSVGVFTAVVGSPMFVVLILAAVALCALLARTGDRPIVTAPARTVHWYRWLIAGAAMFAVGLVSVTVDGPELTTIGWTVWILSWASAAVLGVFSVVLAISNLLRRPA